jgi:hypothetical protein
MEWYYAKNGQQIGPVSEEQLLDEYRIGAIQGGDLVWNESMANWAPLSSIPGLISSPPPASSGQGASPYGVPGAAVVATAVVQGQAPGGQPSPPTYLWQSIVCILICCWPFAIPAIVFGTKIKPAMEAGDYQAALEASKKAKMWCMVSFIVGIIVQAILFIAFFVVGMSEAAAGQ